MKLFSSIIFSLALLVGIGFATQYAHAQVAGCMTTNGYNTTTGMPCSGTTAVPIGCLGTAGFSSATGTPCNGLSAAANSYNGNTVDTNGYLNGCLSTSGFSATTGYPCNMAVNGIMYTGNGTTVNTGVPPIITPPTTVNPGLPTTGAGQNALLNLGALLAAALVAAAGIRYGLRSMTTK